jgi:uncharacterized protein YkwD
MQRRSLFLAAALTAAFVVPAPAQDEGQAESTAALPLGGDEVPVTVFSPDDRADPDAGNWDIDALDTGRDAEYLTGLEKDVLLEMNMVRSDPKKYAELYIKPMTANFQGNLYTDPEEGTWRTREGRKAVNECIRVLSGMRAVPLLHPERGLSLAARDHVRDTGKTGKIGHTGGDGSNPVRRAKRHGRGTYVGENIDYGYNTGRKTVLRLLIDDGVSSRGHRRNVMRAEYNQAGIAAGPHKRYGYMCVIDYAKEYVSNPVKETADTAEEHT